MFQRAGICLALLICCFFSNAQKKSGNSEQPVSNPTASPGSETNTFTGNYNQQSIDHVYSVVNKVEQTQNFINLGNLSPDSNVALEGRLSIQCTLSRIIHRKNDRTRKEKVR
jgi:hypothetical protein